ncbi:MAG: alanine dehydrogenase [Candidatus Hydrothermarchaeota archaeon]
METLILSGEEVERLLDIERVMEVVEEAFSAYAKNEAEMPPKSYIYYPKGDLRTMPAYLKYNETSGVKIVNVHTGNVDLPTVMAILELIDPNTGFPLAIMDATRITAYRTGAAGGIAIKYLSRDDSKTIGLVGAGVQARTQLLAALKIREMENVFVYDIRKEASLEFQKFAQELGLNTRVCSGISEVTENCDVLITATPVRRPIVNSVSPGTHINAIGADAPGKQEINPDIIKRAKIVIDDWEQACHSGEINVPLSKGILKKEDIYGTLGEICAGIKEGRVNDDEITLFDSTGLAIQDVSTGYFIYKEAVKRNIGQWIKFV